MFHTCSFNCEVYLILFFLPIGLLVKNKINKNLTLNHDFKNIIIIYILLFLTFIFHFSFFKNNHLFLLFFLLSIVSFRFLSFNIYFINIINSAETSNIKILTIFKDLLNTLAFFLRFSIQPIRIVLIIINLFLFSEFLSTVYLINISILTQWLVTLIRFCFEYIDFIAVFLIQFSAFNLMLFWLLKYMFSNNLNNVFEL